MDVDIRREVWISRAFLALTSIACLLLGKGLIESINFDVSERDFDSAVEHAVFALIVVLLLHGNLVFQLTRLGRLRRQLQHAPMPLSELAAVFRKNAPRVVFLIPSYNEDEKVISQTVLSAALQECPNRRVVLLIDDPPSPADEEARASLERARRVPKAVSERLSKPASRFAEADSAFRARLEADDFDPRDETAVLAELHAMASAWFDSEAANYPQLDHTDRHFVELVFAEPAARHRQRRDELAAIHAEGSALRPSEIELEYRRLTERFEVEITSFERKQYLNLSHAPNKAMNLNGYIGLLGGAYREVFSAEGVCLTPTSEPDPDLCVPQASFIVSLDADSLISSDYACRLIHLMEQAGNERVAVAQTPYSAIRGAEGLLERIAGATTDIQYLIHQGFTRYRATYWVGANACLRKAALDDLVELDTERGFEIRRFIQDRTVIEDTESSVDLIELGWTLYNYPERLAFSATPPDFGSLLIQRRRWANGGLIIFPKLMRYFWRGPWSPRKLAEAFMRTHYLTSIAGVNLCLLTLIAYPFDVVMRDPWLSVAALPYFVLYGRDLNLMGYRKGDLMRTYALNLLLVTVNLAGVLNSIAQGLYGRKIPFSRTPKIKDRVSVPASHLIYPIVIASFALGVAAADVANGHWFHATFNTLNGALLIYALVHFIGRREMTTDLRLSR